jgi:hypothetical protein
MLPRLMSNFASQIPRETGAEFEFLPETNRRMPMGEGKNSKIAPVSQGDGRKNWHKPRILFVLLLLIAIPIGGGCNTPAPPSLPGVFRDKCKLLPPPRPPVECCCRHHTETPPPPRLPRNFRWKGRYLVPDLNVDVPFIWNGNNGDVQMVAGGLKYPIFFTNLIYHNHLYTYTYKWPCLQPPFLPPLEPCKPLLEITLEELNAFLATAHFVGPEILEGNPCRYVNHFRINIVLPRSPPGFHLRIPITSADIYVDQADPSKFWKVLHFGLQNLYDPDLDEWIVLTEHEEGPGPIKLPAACSKCGHPKEPDAADF